MKRSLGSSDSLGALMSICPHSDEHSPRNNNIYSREFESLLDGIDEEGCCVEESGGDGGGGGAAAAAAGKKRRLSVDQVKALEKNFEVENKLEPDRKVKLAQELGLQTRQVAVWFQNRRARWKTKQLERDYGVLKTSYETLKANFNTLQHDNEALLKEITELKAKINGDSEESNVSVKEEVNHCFPNNNSNGSPVGGGGATVFPDLKDGSSDSDSSAVLNEEHNNNNGSSSSPNNEAVHLLMSPTTDSSLNFNSSSSSSSPSSMDCFQLSKTIYYQPQHYQQYVKMEEHDFISSTADEVCNFFSDEQAPSLHCYCPEQWI